MSISVSGPVGRLMVGGSAGQLKSLLDRFARSERLPPERMEHEQFGQLAKLLAHACRHAPYYRERLQSAGYASETQLTRESWQRLPVLERATVQADGEALRCRELPPGHVVVGEVHTSGATGRPIRVLKTNVVQLLWEALTLREHIWHGRDFHATLAGVRWYPDGVAEPPHGQQWQNWGAPVAKVSLSGPAFGLSVTATAAEQARWLANVQPDYLVIFPSLLPDLVRECRAQGVALTRLKHLRTVSECLDVAARVLARESWNVPVHDIYSAQEVGYIALQCPQHEHYHVQAESVYVEVLDDVGNTCRPGEVGRVVVTPLHNFAHPLVRYAIGDYAEVGIPCACGRGLPVLRRILGRQRNMLTLPDGGRVWPRLSELKYGDVLPVTQFQMVQKELTWLEVRLVATRRGTLEEERRLRSVIVARLGYPFDVSFVYVDRIARSAGGKFEDFQSEVASPAGHGRPGWNHSS